MVIYLVYLDDNDDPLVTGDYIATEVHTHPRCHLTLSDQVIKACSCS